MNVKSQIGTFLTCALFLACAVGAAAQQNNDSDRRQLRQLIFPTLSEAMKARERILAGASFDDIAMERGLKKSDIEIGLVKRSEIIDPKVADAAFALKPGHISQPIKGSFGVSLIMVGSERSAESKPVVGSEATALSPQEQLQRLYGDYVGVKFCYEYAPGTIADQQVNSIKLRTKEVEKQLKSSGAPLDEDTAWKQATLQLPEARKSMKGPFSQPLSQIFLNTFCSSVVDGFWERYGGRPTSETTSPMMKKDF